MDNLKSDKKRISEIQKLRESYECIFKGVLCTCGSNGSIPTERNHSIQKKTYLESIANKNKVMVFDIEQQSYVQNKSKLFEKKIDNVNRYRILCGVHDKLLFNEIENGKAFDINSKRQCFQFAFRPFIFNYSQCLIKDNFKLVHKLYERVSKVYLLQYRRTFERFKSDFEMENWDDVETEFLILNKKVEFVSSFYTNPFFTINNKYTYLKEGISFNVFPRGAETVVLMTYFKDASQKVKNFCKNICECYKNGEIDKFERYMSKLVIVSDLNLAINPLKWNYMHEEEKRNFEEFAYMYKKQRKKLGLIKFVKVIKKNCKCNLFSEKQLSIINK